MNIAEDADTALADAKRYLDGYYAANYTPERLRSWGVHGPPAHCIEALRGFIDSGCQRITFRLATTGDAMEQFRMWSEVEARVIAASGIGLD